MRKQLLLLLLIVLIKSSPTYSQYKDYDKVLGFACGGAGSSTSVVRNAGTFLFEKKYKPIIKFLYSKNTAENFLGVIICEKLEQKKLIILKQKDLQRISMLYKSDKLVAVCGGCIPSENLKLSLLLKYKNSEGIREEADYWLNGIL